MITIHKHYIMEGVLEIQEWAIEYTVAPSVIDFRYSGEHFAAEMLGMRDVVGINRQRILMAFIDAPRPTFLRVTNGDIRIQRIVAWGKDGKTIPITVKTNNDEMQNIKSEWNTSDSKYEELNKTSRGSRARKTRVTYTLEGKKITMNEKGKKIRTKK